MSRTENSQRLEEEVAKLRTEHQERAGTAPAGAGGPGPDRRSSPAAPSTAVEAPAPRPVFGDRFSTTDDGGRLRRRADVEGLDRGRGRGRRGGDHRDRRLSVVGPRAGKPAKAPETAPEVAVTEPEKPATPAPRTRRNARGDAAADRQGRRGTPVGDDAEQDLVGLLTVYSRVPLDLIIDGVRVGSTEDGQIVVPAGRRRVELVNKRLNYRGEVTLDVASGQVTTHTATLPPGQLRIAGAPGGEVWVEGEHVGTLPLGDISVPLGTREVLVRHPLFGERRRRWKSPTARPRRCRCCSRNRAPARPRTPPRSWRR